MTQNPLCGTHHHPGQFSMEIPGQFSAEIYSKDYYRCAGQKERGTCTNRISVRKGAVESGTLAVLQNHLFTDEHARIFAETFNLEVKKSSGTNADRNKAHRTRLATVEVELGNLAANMLQGVVSSTLVKMLNEREAEKRQIEALLTNEAQAEQRAQVLAHPELVNRFRSKVEALRKSLDDELIRAEAADVMDSLIESVTIYPDGTGGAEAEIVANVIDLAAFATNDHAALGGGAFDHSMSSMAVVAGAGFEPATFRL